MRGTVLKTRQFTCMVSVSTSPETIGRDNQARLSRKGFQPCIRSYPTQNSWRNVPSSVFTSSCVDDPGSNGVGARQTLNNLSFRALGHHLGTTYHSRNSVDQPGGGVNVPKGILTEPSASVDSDLGTWWYDNAPDVETESVCLRLSTPYVNTIPVGASGSPLQKLRSLRYRESSHLNSRTCVRHFPRPKACRGSGDSVHPLMKDVLLSAEHIQRRGNSTEQCMNSLFDRPVQSLSSRTQKNLVYQTITQCKSLFYSHL